MNQILGPLLSKPEKIMSTSGISVFFLWIWFLFTWKNWPPWFPEYPDFTVVIGKKSGWLCFCYCMSYGIIKELRGRYPSLKSYNKYILGIHFLKISFLTLSKILMPMIKIFHSQKNLRIFLWPDMISHSPNYLLTKVWYILIK